MGGGITMKFHVFDDGDPEVGIYPCYCEITFPDVYNTGYDADDIAEIKDFLLSFYDAQAVLTEDEYQKLIDFEKQHITMGD
jgi:hypothetical protein